MRFLFRIDFVGDCERHRGHRWSRSFEGCIFVVVGRIHPRATERSLKLKSNLVIVCHFFIYTMHTSSNVASYGRSPDFVSGRGLFTPAEQFDLYTALMSSLTDGHDSAALKDCGGNAGVSMAHGHSFTCALRRKHRSAIEKGVGAGGGGGGGIK